MAKFGYLEHRCLGLPPVPNLHFFWDKFGEQLLFAVITPHQLTWKCTDPCRKTTFPLGKGRFALPCLGGRVNAICLGQGFPKHALRTTDLELPDAWVSGMTLGRGSGAAAVDERKFRGAGLGRTSINVNNAGGAGGVNCAGKQQVRFGRMDVKRCRWFCLRGAFCLDVRTFTFCQLMGFPLNH